MRSASASRSEKFGNYARPAAPLLLLILSLALLLPGVAAAATAPSLGTARSFAVLGGSTVTNTGPSSVEGDLGVSPGNTAPGFPPGMVTGGAFHLADAVALQAQDDVTTAYNALRGQVCEPGNDLTGQDLGGKALLAGVYCYSSSAQLTGALTLDAQGDAGAVFIFKIASTLTTASNATVRVINGGSPCNVYWQVGSSATLGTGTTFVGNILALTSITLNTGATIIPGRALARNGAVTLDTNTISTAGCASAAAPAPTPAPVTATPVPPATQVAAPSPGPVATAPAAPATQVATPSPSPAVGAPATPAAPSGPTPPPAPPEPGPSEPAPAEDSPAEAVATPVPATATPLTTPTPATPTATPIATATPRATGTVVPTITATPTAPRPTTSAAPQPTPPATGNNGNLPGLPNSGDGGGGPVTGLTLGALLVIALLGMMVVLRVRSPKGRA